MPNRKIKHIVAKLVGASTEETLDVYDVDAVHTDKIKNDLVTSTAGYVLDARCGKTLADQLNKFNLTTSSSSVALTPSTTWADSSGVQTMGTISSSYPIRWSLNSDRSIGKIYGQVRISNLVGSGGRMWFQTPIVVASTGSAYQIAGVMSGAFWKDDGSWGAISNPYFQIGGSGGVYLSILCSNAVTTYSSIEINLPACLYFFKDLGDVTVG